MKFWLQPVMQFHVWLLDHLGLHPRVVSTVRSHAEQEDLYINRASNPNPVAPPGTSQHEWGLAYDLTCDDLQTSAVIGQALGLQWAESDPAHFQLFPRGVWSQLLPFLSQGRA